MTSQKRYNRVNIIDKVTRPIIGLVTGYKGMPTYPSYEWNGCTIHIKPHDYPRSWFRSIPFYNGSIAEFDFVLQVPSNKILTRDVKFTWRLHFKGQGIEHKGIGQEPDRNGNGIILLKEMQQCRGFLPKFGNSGLVFRRTSFETAYNLKSGVNCGRMLGERGDYELTLHITNGDERKDIDMVGTQFELKNIDDYHVQFVTALQSAALGALAGLLASIIWLAIMGH